MQIIDKYERDDELKKKGKRVERRETGGTFFHFLSLLRVTPENFHGFLLKSVFTVIEATVLLSLFLLSSS